MCTCVCMLSCFSSVLLTTARQAPLSKGFSRQEHWSGLPCLPPGDLPDPGMELLSFISCIGRWALCHKCRLKGIYIYIYTHSHRLSTKNLYNNFVQTWALLIEFYFFNLIIYYIYTHTHLSIQAYLYVHLKTLLLYVLQGETILCSLSFKYFFSQQLVERIKPSAILGKKNENSFQQLVMNSSLLLHISLPF